MFKCLIKLNILSVKTNKIFPFGTLTFNENKVKRAVGKIKICGHYLCFGNLYKSFKNIYKINFSIWLFVFTQKISESHKKKKMNTKKKSKKKRLKARLEKYT